MKITIRDGISPSLALRCVESVVRGGRVSEGEHGRMYYCWATLFATAEGTICVATRQYRKDDCFVVYRHERGDATETV